MEKRGQVSTYVIIGVAIVILIIAGYFLRGTVTEKKLSPEEIAFQREAEPVRLMVEGCLKGEVEKALLALGFQGGHIAHPELGFEFRRDLIIGYGLYETRNLLPGVEEIGSEIIEFINFDVSNCADFSDVGFDVSEERGPSARAVIYEDSVNARLSWPLKVSKLDRSTVFSDVYEINIPVRLGYLIDVSNNIVGHMIENEGYVSLTYLEELDLRTEINKIDDKQSLITLIDDSTKLGGESYSFQFVNKVS